MRRVEAVRSAALRAVLLSAVTVLAGCGDAKPVPPEVPSVGRYQIVSGQYRYYAPSGMASFTASAIFKIDTATGETYQFIGDSDNLGGSWVKVK